MLELLIIIPLQFCQDSFGDCQVITLGFVIFDFYYGFKVLQFTANVLTLIFCGKLMNILGTVPMQRIPTN